jgi:hypothetical protein
MIGDPDSSKRCRRDPKEAAPASVLRSRSQAPRHGSRVTGSGRQPLKEAAMKLAHLVLTLAFIGSGVSAAALEPPQIWRDQETGCAYLLTPQGGATLRYRRDGLPDCPDAGTASRLVDETTRGLAQGWENLQRELERLKDRFRDPPPAGESDGNL